MYTNHCFVFPLFDRFALASPVTMMKPFQLSAAITNQES